MFLAIMMHTDLMMSAHSLSNLKRCANLHLPRDLSFKILPYYTFVTGLDTSAIHVLQIWLKHTEYLKGHHLTSCHYCSWSSIALNVPAMFSTTVPALQFHPYTLATPIFSNHIHSHHHLISFLLTFQQQFLIFNLSLVHLYHLF